MRAINPARNASAAAASSGGAGAWPCGGAVAARGWLMALSARSGGVHVPWCDLHIWMILAAVCRCALAYMGWQCANCADSERFLDGLAFVYKFPARLRQSGRGLTAVVQSICVVDRRVRVLSRGRHRSTLAPHEYPILYTALCYSACIGTIEVGCVCRVLHWH